MGRRRGTSTGANLVPEAETTLDTRPGRSGTEAACRATSALTEADSTVATPSPRAPAGRMPRPGDTIGRHVLLSELGRGGMGHVFAARDVGLDRLVAIKFVAVRSREMIERFLREARATARCTHPNIVVVHEIGEHDGMPYMVLEHLEGERLSDVARAKNLPLERVLAIMTAVARALECAHSHGVVHRDLKPGNIIVLPDGQVKVFDFGIAAYATRLVDDDGDLTDSQRTGELAGTLPYMSPEQATGIAVDARSDIWSYGVLLYQLLAGRHPFHGLSREQLQLELTTLGGVGGRMPSLAEARPDLPPRLAGVVARCLKKRRSRRYQHTSDLVFALQRLAGEDAATDLETWLGSAPSYAETERVVRGLVQALAAHHRASGKPVGLSRALILVRPDGAVDLGASRVRARAETWRPPRGDRAELRPTHAHDTYAAAGLALQILDVAGGEPTSEQVRRERRLRRALAAARAQTPSLRPSAAELEHRVDAALAPRRRHRGWAVASVAAGVLAALVVVLGFGRHSVTGPDRRGLARLDVLERDMAAVRASGDDQAVEDMFATFVGQPENEAVRAEAWLRRAGSELQRAAYDDALHAYASGYMAAGVEPQRQRALAGVAAVHYATRRWPELARTLALIPDDPVDGRIRTAREHVALAMRRSEARAAQEPVVAAAAATLLAGTRVPADGYVLRAHSVDLDGDARAELVVVTSNGVTAWRLVGGPVQMWRYPVSGSSGACFGADATGTLVAVQDHRRTTLLALDDTGAHAVAATDSGWACAITDLDGDGRVELFASGRAQELVRLRRDPDGAWSERRFDMGSIVEAIAGDDLDGDGRQELVLAIGEWRAYEVRILRDRAGDLDLVDRARLGRIIDLASIRAGSGSGRVLLAQKDSSYPSAVYLPPDRPSAGPDGTYFLRFAGDRLTLAAHEPSNGYLRVGDIDGDGADEILVRSVSHESEEPAASAAAPGSEVLRRSDDGAFDSAVIDGLAVIDVVQLDRDVAAEVVAVVAEDGDEQLWVLGLGTEPVPPRPGAGALPGHVPPSMSLVPDLRATWTRADEMARLGATRTAIESLERVAAIAPPDARQLVRARIDTLRRTRGDALGPVYEEIAGRESAGGPERSRALFGAAAEYAHAAVPEAATRVLDQLGPARGLSADARERAAAFRRQTALAVQAVVTGERLAAPWRILDSLGIRWDPITKELQLDALGDQVIAALPLHRTHGPLRLTVSGTLARSEWGAGLRFDVTPRGESSDTPLVIEIGVYGGGGIYELLAGTPGWRASVSHKEVDAPIAIEAEVTAIPELGRARVEVRVGAHERVVVRDFDLADAAVADAAAWDLRISSLDLSPQSGMGRTAFTVSRLEIAGLEVDRAARDPAEQAGLRALANGDEASARRLLARAPDSLGRRTAEVLLVLRAGDAGAAVKALERLGDAGLDDTRALFARIARIEDGAYATAVRTAAGRDASTVMALAWNAIAWHHPSAILVQRQLTRHLRDLRAWAATPDSAMLRLMRARARDILGDADGAIEDLEWLLEPRQRRFTPAFARELAQLDLARIAARAGDADAARRHALAAMDTSPWPALTADAILLDRDLRPLTSSPGWERAHDLGRDLAWPPPASPR